MKRLFSAFALILLSLCLSAQGRGLLMSEYERIGSPDLFKAGGEWFPYPDYSDRQGWDDLLGEAASKLIRAGEKYLDYKWQIVRATDYLEY